MSTAFLPRRWAVSAAWATLAGGVAAVLPAGWGLLYAGGGHGTYLPWTVFFAPFWVVWEAASGTFLQPLATNATMFLGMVILYAAYGLILALARQRGGGMLAGGAILASHYGGVLWLQLVSKSGETLATAWPLVQLRGLAMFLLVTTYLIGLHLLMFQYARTPSDYRPRLTRLSLVVVLSSLVVATLLFSLTGH